SNFCLSRERGVAEILTATGRPVAEAERIRIVPPAARVVGGAEEDLAADVGVLEADADELCQILRRYPYREPAQIDRRIAEIADADRGDAHAVLGGIERAKRLAERLRHAVARIRPH